MDPLIPAANAVSNDLRPRLNARWRVFLMQGIVMILLGVLAIALPVFTTVAIEMLIGWLLFIGGVWRAIHVLRANHGPGFGWSLAMATIEMALGLLLLIEPLPGVLTLTLLLFALFVLDGLGKILFALDLREHAKEWGWPLATGMTDLLFATLIVIGWPGTATWAIGLLVGVNMMFFGVALTMIAIAARRARGEDLEKIVTADRYVPQEESRPAR